MCEKENKKVLNVSIDDILCCECETDSPPKVINLENNSNPNDNKEWTIRVD